MSDTKGSKRALCVDDEPFIRELVERRLMSRGYEVILAGNAEEALRHVNDVDIILTDLNMPGKDGYWLISRVPPGKAVVVMTGRSSIDDRVRDTAAAVLPKPFEREEFDAAMTEAERYVGANGYQPV